MTSHNKGKILPIPKKGRRNMMNNSEKNLGTHGFQRGISEICKLKDQQENRTTNRTAIKINSCLCNASQ